MYSIKELQRIISDEIQNEAINIYKTEPVNLYQPISYTLNMGGKRLRPVMVLLAYNMFKEDIKKAFPVALAIEIFHNFTLLHDDIMDNADIRRGHDSVHKRFNENAAILSGDAMSILAYQYLLKAESKNIQAISQLFSQTAIEVCEGQQYDMDFEDRMDVTIDEYLTMISLKTAVLIACSLKAGALLAAADEKTAEQIYDFGINLGLAFQLQDDLLDVYANEDKFGKKIGGDIVSNKKTFLLLKTLELAKGETKQQLEAWISKTEFDPAEKIKEVRGIYNLLGVRSIAENKVDKFYQKAMQVLEEIELPNEKKSELTGLAKLIMQRDH